MIIKGYFNKNHKCENCMLKPYREIMERAKVMYNISSDEFSITYPSQCDNCQRVYKK